MRSFVRRPLGRAARTVSAILLALALLIGCLPLYVGAEEPEQVPGNEAPVTPGSSNEPRTSGGEDPVDGSLPEDGTDSQEDSLLGIATITEAAGEVDPAPLDVTSAFSVTIGGTVFTVTPGSTTGDYVTASGGDGSVEIATAYGAVIWANLGGAGSGILAEDKITGLDAGTFTIDGNTLTIGGYNITVRDNSASGTPVAGYSAMYDFRDGSVVSTLYHNGLTISGGKTVSSSDGLLTLVGNKGISYNGAQHGIIISDDDQISIKVAGNATIELSVCWYSASNGQYSISTDASVLISAQSTTQNADGEVKTFTYEGDATTITFTYNGSNVAYLHSISVTNEAEQTTTNPQVATPTYDKLTATPTGQRLTLTQTGGSLATGSLLSDMVGYYGFSIPKESADRTYTLEADVTVTECDNSSAYGVFLGAYWGDGIAIAGIRNSTNLRALHINNSSNVSATGMNVTIEEGQTVHFNAVKTGSNITITLTPDGGESYTATLSCEQTCFLGFAMASATATVTNMKYSVDGEIQYDQNAAYDPIGQAPVITGVTASLTDTRDAITVSWTVSQQASGDGYAQVQVSTDNGGTWTNVARATGNTLSYTYPISQSGTYQFRVTGGLGSGDIGEDATWGKSASISVIRALETPVVEAKANGAASVTLTWASVEDAARYDIYRYHDDQAAELLDTVEGGTTYTDTTVTAEVPYYYYVIAYEAAPAEGEPNFSNPSATVWALPSDGHSWPYLTEDAAQFTLTSGMAETVFESALTLTGTVDQAGVVRAYLNGRQVGTDQIVGASGTFSYNLTLETGSNVVTLIHTNASSQWSREVYTYYYLPENSIDIVVNADYIGVAGAESENGKPTYSTVQAAVNSVPVGNSKEAVIFVRAGSYEEHLTVSSPNITLIGEGDGTWIHCYPADFHPEDTTYEAGGDMSKRCATYIQSTATNFCAANLKFENDYVYGTNDGKGNKSADALRCDANNAQFFNVTISGVQDTLYMDAGVQTYTNCRIEGAIDFIYSGNAAQALFNDCEIVYVYEPTRSSGVICAPRTAEDADCGLVFYRCSIIAEEGCTPDTLSLARPWGADAAVYWIDCYMSDAVDMEEPYHDMSGNSFLAARFYECHSYGPGYAVNTDRRQISRAEAQDLLWIFGVTDAEFLPGAHLSTETPDVPSGGGSSSAVTTPDVTTDDTTQNGQTTTETVATPSVSVSGSTASSIVSSSMGSEIVSQAQENNSDTVIIAPEMSGSVDRTEVTLPSSTVERIGTETNASLTVSTPVAQVTIPNGGLADLASGSGSITVAAEAEGNTVSVEVTSGGETVSAVIGGITVTVPADATTPGTVAVLVLEDGTTEVIRKSVAGEDTVTIPLDGSATVEIMDNRKTFVDVPADSWYAGAVAFVSSHELFHGTSNTTFTPNGGMTRAMLAQVLYNLESNPDTEVEASFTDVAADAWCADAVAWAQTFGVIKGVTATSFAPNTQITRQQIAVMLYRYAKALGYDLTGGASITGYADAAQVGGYAVEAMEWATGNGLIQGLSNGTLNPKGTATRAQVATILMRFCENIMN